MRVLGILLVVAGVLLMAFGGVTFFIPSEVIDFGSLSITIRDNMVIPLPPIVGLLFLVLGVVMIMSTPVIMAPPPPY